MRIQVNANHPPAAIEGLVTELAALQRKFALPTTVEQPIRNAA